MNPRLTFLLALCSLSLLPACGDDAGENKLKKIDGFCESWATRACSEDMELQCGADTEADCENAQKEFCLDTVGREKYSGVGAEECLDAVRDAYLDGRLSAEERDVVLYLKGECDQIQSGTGEEDDACKTDSDCQRVNGFACVMPQGETSGSCQIPTNVSGGRSCKDPKSVCEEGFYCDEEFDCIALPEEGDACSLERPCGGGFRCEIEPGTSEGLCVERLANNDPGCLADSDCKSNICLEDGREF
jgi:hypothetical protein